MKGSRLIISHPQASMKTKSGRIDFTTALLSAKILGGENFAATGF
jgi:hypothetical protein